ncbi:HAD-IA family hydrolase [Lacimicrobium alkaliphilum]|uniref:2-haloalkanoic acid dehalogenase n=1 Tax=Lacimicrobium alkaliphilum TaxID=1526571 RepID=A0ABQ1RM31_9ALTE|nr:HAD-IA family hydrolase [Lacimicrobium alkaliphilum]GGD71226.1 2-haloalkanoic acid dehalogenase [Lacimicrobium alkaliphilum]
MIIYRPLQPITALSFDLDDTLYNNHRIMVRAERALLDFLHLEYPDTATHGIEFWRQIKAELLQQRPDLHNDMGELRRQQLYQGLHSCGYRSETLATATQVAFDYFYAQRSDFKVDQSVCSLLDKLAQKLPLVAITNGNVNLEKIGIAGYFSACYHASMKQPMKPHTCMFNAAQQHLGIPTRQILHIGDGLRNDIAGALNAGYQAAWFAANRPMSISDEPAGVLPHVQLDRLEELLQLVNN